MKDGFVTTKCPLTNERTLGIMGDEIECYYHFGKRAKSMAAQFSSPITVWINLCDREPEREDEVMELVRKHVMQFFEIYRK